MDRRAACLWIMALSCLLLADVVQAGNCDTWVAKLVSLEGTIEAKLANHTTWQPARVGDTFCPGDTIRLEQWRAAIVLSNETIIRLDEGTYLTFSKLEEDTPSFLNLLKGLVHFISRVPRSLTVTTPFVNAFVEGTEFVIRVTQNEATIWVFEGQVLARNEQGKLTLVNGQTAVAKAGEAPVRRVIVKPRNAVQWALYYPPLIDDRAVKLNSPNANMIQRALARYRAGNLHGALQQLDAVPPSDRNAQYFTTRAGLLLSVGRVETARADIAEALRADPNNGDAIALQSVIAVVQNEKDRALRLAKQAAKHAPDSPVPQIALSYAYQATFNIDQALDSAQKATELAPDDSLAWARVAELWLSKGYTGDALEAAEKAVSLNPHLARTHTILGFAQVMQSSLIQWNRQEVKDSFQTAIDLDQADPLPRLGLGLAKIREGHVAEGRREIEIAASLDPNNPLIRSYLGKAYFEERRDELDATQLDMAKALDPQDPTPYFYDAIRKQLANRPVEALHDLQKSIELNDNRAVYRSRLLLDEDQAARSATVGRIYRDLGFQQRALVQGWKSVTRDPTNHSAHRLLADSYISRPRHEIARVSELLQAQLLGPLNINNLQPQLAERSLQILEGAGPSSLSFNEFNPLFIRDRLSLQPNLVIGNNDTLGNDVVFSGLYGPVSLSLGQFHYETDGFRRNNDINDDIYNVFAQADVTSWLNVQTEYRKRDRKQGDLQLRFDPDNFSNERRDLEQDIMRVGARLTPQPHSTFLFSWFYTHRDDRTNTPPFLEGRTESDGQQFEGQYLFRHDIINTIVGGGISKIDDNAETKAFGFSITNKFKSRHDNGYVYTNINLPTPITWTFGLTLDSLDIPERNVTKLSPKAGFQWNISQWGRLRLAYLRTFKRVIAVDQTLEPTQIAGFNQFFDDINGTESERYGIGFDVIPLPNTYTGIEYSRREIKAPLQFFSAFREFERREQLLRGYIYVTPHPEWAFGAEIEFERFKRSSQDPTVTIPVGAVPRTVETVTVPMSIRYFHPSGVFALFGGTVVHQEIDPPPSSTTFRSDNDSFFLIDAALGYRLPQRTGIISLEGKNLFDKEFFYQDANIQTTRLDLTPRFFPDRIVILRITFALN
ncbi:MAG: hypothetical protein NPIRA02_35710 [Nitrospirales bacterium]|nr:MAG: hypothetical protein NPIRA02_35710 [Nitrospirales bacterium]